MAGSRSVGAINSQLGRCGRWAPAPAAGLRRPSEGSKGWGISRAGRREVICRAGSRNGARATEEAESRDALRDPAHVYATKSMEVAVRDPGGEAGLDAYMRLPVTKYNVLDSKLIQFLGGNRFRLQVPKINLLNVWIEPLAIVTVDHLSNPPRVVMKTESCWMEGSDVLDALNLNKRFCLDFEATLTWQARSPAPTAGSSPSQHRVNSTGRSLGGSVRPKIRGDTRLDVWCEVVPPFTLMPRPIMEASCNTGLDALMQMLLPMFMSKLSGDYREWAADAAYRRHRSTVALKPVKL
ncbi:unnamed protein product [Ostreobium quekettii]|uniref:Uncharacterized protein n=1 Tax=Ostreobium quekettii TaxID=121088 RepID=A0A8S1J0Y3_9CHLO|nr:unnamed protein product [Ostreobium quekettii]